MKIKRPLINPEVEIPITSITGSRISPTVEPSEQLNLGINDPAGVKIQRVFSSAKMVIKKRGMQLEISTLWKSPALAFAIISSFFNAFIIFVGGLLVFDRIPAKVPLLYDSINTKWIQVDKLAVFIYAGFILAFEILLIQILIRVFRFDRRFSLTGWWILTFVNVLYFLAISQIYLLIS